MAFALFAQVSVITEMFLDLSLPVSDEVKSHFLRDIFFIPLFVSMSYCNYIL